jgi:hypothetical protein
MPPVFNSKIFKFEDGKAPVHIEALPKRRDLSKHALVAEYASRGLFNLIAADIDDVDTANLLARAFEAHIATDVPINVSEEEQKRLKANRIVHVLPPSSKIE